MLKNFEITLKLADWSDLLFQPIGVGLLEADRGIRCAYHRQGL